MTLTSISLAKLEAYAVGALVSVIAVIGMYFYAEHEGRVDGRKEIQVQFDTFKNQVAATALQAETEKQKKEAEYEKNLAAANSARDAAVLSMQRLAATRPAGSSLSRAPAAPAGSSQVCIDSTTYNAAFQQYRSRLVESMGRLGEIATAGATAQIDAQTAINAWPR